MNQKWIIGIFIGIFVLLIGGAVFAYNMLRFQVQPEMNLGVHSESGVSEAVSGNPSGLAEGSGSHSQGAASENTQPAPDFTMEDAQGNSVSLADLIADGKPIVLNFWASWCGPCKSEMPEFNQVFEELGEEIQFVMVDLADGQRETKEDGMAYVEAQGFTFPVYYDTLQDGAETYGIYSIPTSLFIDKAGNIVTGVQGAIDEATLRKAIEMIR